jgi:predicted Zn-dependent peptidase
MMKRNAATATETTAYHARVLKDDWRLALDILADILIDPAFDAEELDRERAELSRMKSAR